ncbi:MAG: creatininase family protein [Desulfuromonadales bacterium]|nr:creatininase family protein [Desulfuromonadales bacterium]
MIIEEMTMVEFGAGLKTTRTVIVPFGSTEQHGSHLPLDTDTLQAIDIARVAATRRPLFIAPPVHYGVCRSTAQHPGTIGISTGTLKMLVLDLVSSLYAQGLRYVILLSGHAGTTHMATLVDAGEELLNRFTDIQIAVIKEYDLALKVAQGLLETPGDSHAGEIETSRLLHSHPLLVKGTSPAEYPSFPPGILVRDKQKYWPGGIWGDPTKASAVKGKLLQQHMADRLCEMIVRLEEMG